MRRFHFLAGVLLTALAVPAQVRVVTTAPGLQNIAEQIGGPHVEVETIMRGPENVHNVIPRPTYILRLRRADLFIHKGLDAEPWAPNLVRGARQSHLLYGSEGNIDVHRGVRLVEVPRQGALSRAQGDIHVFGNTHYCLDPLNLVIVAKNISDALRRHDPANTDTYVENYEAYAERMRALTDRLVEKMAPFRGTPVVTYHRTWSYFLRRFGLLKVAEIEPKPGIQPGPQSLAQCSETMKATGCKIVIVETYNSKENADVVAERAGGVAVTLASEVLGFPDVDTYEKLFERNIDLLLAAFEEAGIEGR